MCLTAAANNQYIYKYIYTVINENKQYQCYKSLEGMHLWMFSRPAPLYEEYTSVRANKVLFRPGEVDGAHTD